MKNIEKHELLESISPLIKSDKNTRIVYKTEILSIAVTEGRFRVWSDCLCRNETQGHTFLHRRRTYEN